MTDIGELKNQDLAVLPRQQIGRSPQGMLATIFGDFWLGCDALVPSGALVDLLSDLGISPAGARSAIYRLANRGLIESHRSGRFTSYRLSDHAQAEMRTVLDQVLSFGHTTQRWDGRWRTVIFSVPETQRVLRNRLRKALKGMGYAPLYDAAWVSPTADVQKTVKEITAIGVESASIILSESVHPDVGPSFVSAWDLTALRDRYHNFLASYGDVYSRVASGEVTPAQALAIRTDLMHRYRKFPFSEPLLPDEQFPQSWPRQEVAELFARVYDGLAELATLRVRSVCARHGAHDIPVETHPSATSASRG